LTRHFVSTEVVDSQTIFFHFSRPLMCVCVMDAFISIVESAQNGVVAVWWEKMGVQHPVKTLHTHTHSSLIFIP
jgi:hypothetical protein